MRGFRHVWICVEVAVASSLVACGSSAVGIDSERGQLGGEAPGSASEPAPAVTGSVGTPPHSTPVSSLPPSPSPSAGTFGPTGCDLAAHPDFNTIELTAAQSIVVDTHGTAARLVNRTGGYVQIDTVDAVGDYSGQQGEFSLTMDTMDARYFPPYDVYPNGNASPHPFQPWIGAGEIGDSGKWVPAGATFPTLRYAQVGDPDPTGVSLPPGSCVMVQGHTQAGYIQQFRLGIRPQTRGLVIARQPQTDVVIGCDGTRQYSPAQAWTNTTAETRTIIGMTLELASGKSDPWLEGGCLDIHDASGALRRQYCSGMKSGAVTPLNQAGEYLIGPELIAPGESFVYYAGNTCDGAGAVWGVAAYLHMF